MLQRLSKFLLFFGFILWLLALWQKDVLPAATAVRPQLLDEPRQVAVERSPFQLKIGAVDYEIKPLYEYELYGLVVSRHDSKAWWDHLHKEWNDQLNVADLCVVWGNNIRREAYRDIQFSSGQFVCYFQTSSDKAFAAFDQAAISNNHLLSANARLANQMIDARVGDQVHFSGYLAEYSHNHGQPFKRGTSTVRTDTGNGACETVFVEKFEILQRGGQPWHTLLNVAIAMLIIGVIAWFAAPPRLN